MSLTLTRSLFLSLIEVIFSGVGSGLLTSEDGIDLKAGIALMLFPCF